MELSEHLDARLPRLPAGHPLLITEMQARLRSRRLPSRRRRKSGGSEIMAIVAYRGEFTILRRHREDR
jgi:hypothetical protein